MNKILIEIETEYNNPIHVSIFMQLMKKSLTKEKRFTIKRITMNEEDLLNCTNCEFHKKKSCIYPDPKISNANFICLAFEKKEETLIEDEFNESKDFLSEIHQTCRTCKFKSQFNSKSPYSKCEICKSGENQYQHQDD
jgi:hypothetical protein